MGIFGRSSCPDRRALIALPTLRLSGIYLALATAAFAVFLDRWIFGLEAFNLPFTDVKIAIFGTGSLSVARLQLFGYAFDTEYRQLMLLATAFGLVAIFVAWLRRSPFGRRLLAMKDSPAACATVGMNLMFTKLAVFAISAGIAGLGGALIGGLQRSTNSQNWEFASGLPIFMVAVVGGIARIGGPLFAGISLATLAAIRPGRCSDRYPASPPTVTPGSWASGWPEPERRGRRHPRGLRAATEAQARVLAVPRVARRAVRDRARRRHPRGGSSSVA